jgi:hypothetical protein
MEKSIRFLDFGAKFWILKLKSTYFSTWPNFRTFFSKSFKVFMESFMDSFADSGQETNSTSTAEQVKIANVS